MNKIENIRRIRWSDTDEGRWYGVSTALRLNEKNSAWARCSKAVDAKDWPDFTAACRKIVNQIVAAPGICWVDVGAFGISVRIGPVFSVDDYHDAIVTLLNKTLFDGDADVAQLGVRAENEGLIRWSQTRKETVRWYGVSNALTRDTKRSASTVISEAVGEDNWCRLTEQARQLVNTIHGMKGVYKIWVTAFDLSIEIAPVFDWSDYHDKVVALLTEKILGGKAFVEERKGA